MFKIQVLLVNKSSVLSWLIETVIKVNWAEKEGKAEIQKVFTRSADLNGDAVIIFVRALCAISQEELVPENPSDPPRSEPS